MFAEARHGLADHGVNVKSVQLDLDAMMKRKHRIVRALAGGVDSLLKQNGVTRYLGRGRLDGPGRTIVEQNEGQVLLEAGGVVLACGSKSAVLPGIDLDGDRIGTSTEALAYGEVPERLVVIGAGTIGLELGSVWRRLGAEVIEIGRASWRERV